MIFKAIQHYRDTKKKRNEKSLKRRYYVLFILVMIPFTAYNFFMTTEYFVPKQEMLVNPKGLFTAVMSEISKIEKQSDTIYVSKYTVYAVCGVGEPIKTPYELKIEEIEKRKKPIFDIDKAVEDLYNINNKVIITGFIGNTELFQHGFVCTIAKYNFDSKVDTDKKLYHIDYKIINKNKVEVVVYMDIQGERWNMTFNQKNENWKTIGIRNDTQRVRTAD